MALPRTTVPVTPKEGVPSPILVMSIFPVPELALMFKADKAVVPPITPPKSTAPAPEIISSCFVVVDTESIVLSITTLPAVAELLDEAPV